MDSAQRYKELFHIPEIDLSRALETVNRDILLSVLKTHIDDDEIRPIRQLLRDIILSLRLGNRLLSPFESNTGTTQGDSLSPVLFVVYLRAALRVLARQLDVPHNLLADMIVYADDADFVCWSAEIVTLIKTEASAVLAKWQDRTHHSTTQPNRAVQSDYTSQGRRLAHHAQVRFPPRRRRGRLPPQESSDRRTPSHVKSLAPTIEESEATRLRLYKCYVLPILFYNCDM